MGEPVKVQGLGGRRLKGGENTDDDIGETDPDHLLFVLCTFVMLVVMMNLLIAIMSDSYAKVQQDVGVARTMAKAQLIYEQENKVQGRKRSDATTPCAYLFSCQSSDHSW